jgi:hypothetical protein
MIDANTTELVDQARLRASRKCADGYAVPFDVNLDNALADTIERLTQERDNARAEIADSKLENGYFIGWNSGWDEAFQRLKFPIMLRKMWSGGEVQRWLDERRAEQKGPIPGSLSERMFAAKARVAELEALLDEERLEEIITDSIDLDWTPRTAARAIVRAMKGGET